MLDVVWDMETGDPDDFLTLLLLLGHPQVNLKAVTVTPGTPDQVGLVRQALAWFGREIPVGAHNLDHRPRSLDDEVGPGDGRHGRMATSRRRATRRPAARSCARCATIRRR